MGSDFSGEADGGAVIHIYRQTDRQTDRERGRERERGPAILLAEVWCSLCNVNWRGIYREVMETFGR